MNSIYKKPLPTLSGLARQPNSSITYLNLIQFFPYFLPNTIACKICYATRISFFNAGPQRPFIQIYIYSCVWFFVCFWYNSCHEFRAVYTLQISLCPYSTGNAILWFLKIYTYFFIVFTIRSRLWKERRLTFVYISHYSQSYLHSHLMRPISLLSNTDFA